MIRKIVLILAMLLVASFSVNAQQNSSSIPLELRVKFIKAVLDQRLSNVQVALIWTQADVAYRTGTAENFEQFRIGVIGLKHLRLELQEAPPITTKDFCYTGWVLIASEYYSLGYNGNIQVTVNHYFCQETGNYLNCFDVGGSGETCGPEYQ